MNVRFYLSHDILGVKTSKICRILRNVITCTSFHNATKICKPLSGLSILMHGVISLPDATSSDKDNDDMDKIAQNEQSHHDIHYFTFLVLIFDPHQKQPNSKTAVNSSP